MPLAPIAIGTAAERAAARTVPARSAKEAAKAPAMAARYQPKHGPVAVRESPSREVSGDQGKSGPQCETSSCPEKSGRAAGEQFAQWATADEHLKADGQRDPQEQIGIAAEMKQVPGHHPDADEGDGFHGASATRPVRMQPAGWMRCGAALCSAGRPWSHLRSGCVRGLRRHRMAGPVRPFSGQLMPMTSHWDAGRSHRQNNRGLAIRASQAIRAHPRGSAWPVSVYDSCSCASSPRKGKSRPTDDVRKWNARSGATPQQCVAMSAHSPGCGKRLHGAVDRHPGRELRDAQIVWAAPTGKRRECVTQLARHDAVTAPGRWSCGRAATLPCDRKHMLDADLVVVEKAIKLDPLLANKLVKAIPPGQTCCWSWPRRRRPGCVRRRRRDLDVVRRDEGRRKRVDGGRGKPPEVKDVPRWRRPGNPTHPSG